MTSIAPQTVGQKVLIAVLLFVLFTGTVVGIIAAFLWWVTSGGGFGAIVAVIIIISGIGFVAEMLGS